MGKSEREKGKRGEQEIAALLRSFGFDARRTAQYCGKNSDAADVIGIPGLHIEVKRQEKTRIQEWMRQAERDCGEKVPCVIHRRSREPWYVTLPLDGFMKILKGELGDATSGTVQ